MNLEYVLDKNQIIAINKQFGGNLANDAEIETAPYMGKGRSIFRKIALLMRAILVGHPFVDGNKRTAIIAALKLLDSCKIELDNGQKEKLVSTAIKIAKENIIDLKRIERLIRYVVKGH